MSKLIVVKPSSGDKETSLFSGPDATDKVLTTVPAGTMLKVVGSNSKFYTVEYDNGKENVAQGGTGMTGTIIANPYAVMYNDTLKTKKLGNVNNGTSCEIVDDSNVSMISIKAVTTEGTMTGFVDAKYIYRDKEETPMMFRMTRNTEPEKTGTVKTTSGRLNTRSGPGTDNTIVGGITSGTTVTIHETKSGWHRVTAASGSWGNTTDVWVSANYVVVDESNATADVAKTDAEVVDTRPDDWDAAQASYWEISGGQTDLTVDDDYYRQLADKYAYALGAPPKYNMDIDIQYMDEITPGYGRVVNKTILSNPSILSICPGKVKMFPNLIGSERDSVVDAFTNAAEWNNNRSLMDKITDQDAGRFSGRLYKFEAQTAEYANYLNALCRSIAIMLHIEDEVMPGTTTKLKYFDYSYWTVRKKYDPEAAAAEDADSSIFRNFFPGLIKTVKRLYEVATDNVAYINFFLNGNETSVQETITNSVTESPLTAMVSSISSVASTLNYFTGSGFDIKGDSDVEDALNAVYKSSGSTIGGLKDLAVNFMNGGKMVLPKMVEGASYGKTVSCNMKFVSPYGDPLSVFLKCLVPVAHILALALPKQVSDNMYTYPFLVRCAQIGQFNIDLGIISSLSITRGGSDETSYTVNSLATEWEVQIEITPLVDELMMTGTNHPILLVKNEMLLDYLANFCGFDMLAFNLDTKVEMMWSFIRARITDIPHAIENRVSDFMHNQLNHFFTAL